jgi:hypothetical protein
MPRVVREATLNVSESVLRKTALRVLNGQRLVSPEVDYILRTLGPKATQQELDTMVMRVRKMPWGSLMLPE